MSEDEIPEADRAEGLPHPRHARALIGQEAAEAEFLDAWTSGKMHHGWLIAGPRGVGKATFAWAAAKFLLSQPEAAAGGGLFGDAAAAVPPARLMADPAHPAVRRAEALGEPRLFLLRRGWDPRAKRLRGVITIDEVRKLRNFLALSAADGGWRVAIVDAADEMNLNAANALLKILEEPPPRVVLFLVAHQPSRLLPTIRSRCRVLRCAPLAPAPLAEALAGLGLDPGADAQALAELSGGSVGAAARLLAADGLGLYARIVTMFAAAPGIDRAEARSLAAACAGPAQAQTYDLVRDLLGQFLARLARHGARHGGAWVEAAPQEGRTLARLSPDPAAARRWAELAAVLGARLDHARAVNIDPAAALFDALARIDAAAGQPA